MLISFAYAHIEACNIVHTCARKHTHNIYMHAYMNNKHEHTHKHTHTFTDYKAFTLD